MSKKVNIGENAKVNIKWKVLPIDRTDEAEANIIAKFSAKYGIPKKNISVEPVFISVNDEGEEIAYTNEISTNIQDMAFRHHLYKEFLKMRQIEDVDFDKIAEIDSLIDSKIDYEVYENQKKYTIKWLKWDNFMSYGPNNFIDFTTLKGLVLLSSTPANQGGKTTFCIDLLRFLLFGKITSRETDWTLAKAFNRHIPSATELSVEGCVNIDGTDYIIKRVVTRPDLKRRTATSKVTQKITYYKVVGDNYVELQDDDSENVTGTNGKETNRIIKEAIGNERDFDLMICVNMRNLEDLISLKDTERGRLIARWIGLLPLEEKDKIARETFNKTISPALYMNKYSKEELNNTVKELTEENKQIVTDGEAEKREKEEAEKKLEEYVKTKETLLQSKKDIDETLLKADVETIKRENDSIVNEGKRKRQEKENNEKELDEIKDVEFNESYYDQKVEEDRELSIKLNNEKQAGIRLKNEIDALQKGEYCPTCGARLAGVDNSAAINEKKEQIETIGKSYKETNKRIQEVRQEIAELKTVREKYNRKIRLQLTIEKNEVDIENLLARHKENTRLLKDIKENEEAIKRNNDIETSINIVNENIKTENNIIDNKRSKIEELRVSYTSNKQEIDNCLKIIGIIEKEEVTVRHWKIYLEMVGKNGISKMVLREALPIINGELKHLLTGVCDFDVEVGIDDHNDVTFYQIHDGVRAGLGGGSGFELTVASLALRSVLSKISSFSKPSFVVFDEILGGVADENYDQVKILYDKIVKDYSLIIQITHLKQIADWHNAFITVKKENNISRIETMVNN